MTPPIPTLLNQQPSSYAHITWTPEEIARQERIWANADEIKYGPMPDPATNQVGWMQRIEFRLKAFFQENGWHKERARTAVDGIKQMIAADGVYTVERAFELAKTELRIGKGEKRPMTKPQAPAHEPTIEQISAANAAFKKSEPLPDADAGLNEWFKRETSKDLHKELNEQAAQEEQKPAEGKNVPNRWQGYYIGIGIWGYKGDEIKRQVFDNVAHMDETGLERNAALRIVKGWHFAPADKKADYVWKRDLTASISPDEKPSEPPVSKPAPQDLPKVENNTPPSNDKVGATPVDPTPSVGVYVEKPKSTETAQTAPPLNGKVSTVKSLFIPATREASFLRMALVGPSGSGKTYTGLNIATNLVKDGKVAVIDTERGSARKYADQFKFDVLELRQFSPNAYIEAIKNAIEVGYSVLLIDSLTHAWNGTGGILSIVDQKGGQFNAWKDATPLHHKLIDSILDAKIHIIATMRSKTEYVVEQVEQNGRVKNVPRKVGLAPIQRDGVEYEFDVFAEIDLDNQMTITKSRCMKLPNSTSYPKAGGEVAKVLHDWLA